MNFQQLKQLKTVHFIGLGGIGMSALAFILRYYKIPVQGSDMNENYLTPKLQEVGCEYFLGHDARNISDDVELVVKTSIIKDENPEIIEAQKRSIKIITRAELLAIIMKQYKGITVAGTHGKTSTTGIISVMLEEYGLDPTIINGGVIHYFEANSKVGSGEYLVAESDESDASFVNLPTFIGVVTNIEPEHLDFAGYGGDFNKQRACFKEYIEQIPDDGICAICIDSEEVEKIYDELKETRKNLIPYSIKNHKKAELLAKNLQSDFSGISFDAHFKNGRKIENIKLPIYGTHNISNALSAVAIADFLGFEDKKLKESLAKFNGVKRRFTKVGEFNGAAIIDDYGHHPTEICATLEAARSLVGDKKIICVFEPHKYSRIRDVFEEFCKCFAEADYVIVSEIYAASQKPIAGISQDLIIEGIKKTGHKNVIKLNNIAEIPQIIKPLVLDGDLILFTGAGKVTNWASDFASLK